MVPDADRSIVHEPTDPSAVRCPGQRGLWWRGWKVGAAAALAAVVLGAGGAAALLAAGGGDRAGSGGGPGGALGEGGGGAGGRPGLGGGRPGAASALAAPAGPVVNGRRQPARVPVPESAGGRYERVPGTAVPARASGGTLLRYTVEVERGLPVAGGGFAAEVHRVLNDPRGWGRGGVLRFQRVDRGPVRFRVALSSPALTDRMCAPLVTGGELSCSSGGRSVINARRYGEGAVTYGGDLASYREYVINHEVGHALGHGHQRCPGAGVRAPVMVQQTKSLGGCRPNPWPFPRD
ncbi:DUF3152 domain-containing protein [Actinomadura macra]|uniref:DUF3152 domain-containing protein n=1 Tax=Actinomadura macra TaxID=46164 RepID=UPI000AB0BC1A|nr:DUF3152 domain-containing protein [Actinomadura macra]